MNDLNMFTKGRRFMQALHPERFPYSKKRTVTVGKGVGRGETLRKRRKEGCIEKKQRFTKIVLEGRTRHVERKKGPDHPIRKEGN